jgi:hypothetical protein
MARSSDFANNYQEEGVGRRFNVDDANVLLSHYLPRDFFRLLKSLQICHSLILSLSTLGGQEGGTSGFGKCIDDGTLLLPTF